MSNTKKIQSHYRTCHLCEAMCGLEIKVQGEEIRSIKGDEKDVHSRGHICPKAIALQDIHKDPNRLKYPIKKTDHGWQQIGWQEAFDLVEEKLLGIQRKHGKDVVQTIYQELPIVD